MLDHLTGPSGLTPGAILGTAEADLRKVERNKEAAKNGDLSYRRYVFLRKQVKKAKTAAELLSLAAENPELAKDAPLWETRLIYRETELLRAAIQLAKSREAA